MKDLCDRHYGFLHLPSLFVFVNPYSPYQSVQEFLFHSPLENLGEYLESMPREEAMDLVQRATSLEHESKHFHDILLTPYGNSLFRAFFHHALKCRQLVALARISPDTELALPIE